MASARMIPSRPALLLDDGQRHLVVADMHIGFEARMAANGVRVPGTTAGEAADEVAAIAEEHEAGSIILLGDVKSSIGRISGAEWDDVPRFFERICASAEVTLVPGNHDAGIERLLPDSVTVTGPSGLEVGGALLTHGHAMPSENFAHVSKIIMGHLHPVFFEEGSLINGQRVWVSASVQKRDVFPSMRGRLDILMLPSFNRYLYAAHRGRRGRSISPIIQRIRAFESAQIMTLDGAIIGGEERLHEVI